MCLATLIFQTRSQVENVCVGGDRVMPSGSLGGVMVKHIDIDAGSIHALGAK